MFLQGIKEKHIATIRRTPQCSCQLLLFSRPTARAASAPQTTHLGTAPATASWAPAAQSARETPQNWPHQ